MAWWPILEDVVGYGGGPEYHAVDAWAAPNKDRKAPLVARCGVVVWKLYGVRCQDSAGGDGVMLMPWPPKMTVARQAHDDITGACPECKALAKPKRPLGSWDTVVTEGEAA